MKINILGTEIELKEYHCSLNNKCAQISDKYVNIYVRLENTCNAKCKFCTFTGKSQDFDFYKFYYVINEINKTTRINKISFTGGEPTIKSETLHKCLKTIKTINKNIFTVVNTNGYKLNNLVEMGTDVLLDSIALSRHHYDDNINNSIFNNNMLSKESIKLINHKTDNKIHLSCNLINGYIDSKDEIIKYLNFAASLGIKDVGFVSLMKLNDYCEDKFIDFSNIDVKDQDIVVNKEWKNGDSCKCKNHMFISDIGEIVEFYSRYYIKSDNNSNSLVYDINSLKTGFNGKVII